MTTAYVSNANDLVVSGLTKARDGSPIIDATISVTIYDSTNTAIANGSGLALSYSSGLLVDGVVTGGYIGTIPSVGSGGPDLVAGQDYRAHFSASNYDWSTDVYFTPQSRVG